MRPERDLGAPDDAFPCGAAVAAGHEAEIFSLREHADLTPLVSALLAWAPHLTVTCR